MQKAIEKIETNPKTGATLVRMKVREGEHIHDLAIPFATRTEALAKIRELGDKPDFKDAFRAAVTQRFELGVRNGEDVLTVPKDSLVSTAMNFLKAPGNAWQGKYSPEPETPGVLTEEDAFRQNHARDKEVLDAAQMGWFGPRGGGVLGRGIADYMPSRLTAGAEHDERKNPIAEGTGQ